MSPVYILCCLNPSMSTFNITEYTIYQLLMPYVIVKNIKLISTDGQVKAFVQIGDSCAVEWLISELHDAHTSCGQLQFYLSHKKRITFDKSVQEISAEKRGVIAHIIGKHIRAHSTSDRIDEDDVSPIMKATNNSKPQKGKYSRHEKPPTKNSTGNDILELRSKNQFLIKKNETSPKLYLNQFSMSRESFTEQEIQDYPTAPSRILVNNFSTKVLELNNLRKRDIDPTILIKIFETIGSCKVTYFENYQKFIVEFISNDLLWNAYDQLSNLVVFGERFNFLVREKESVTSWLKLRIEEHKQKPSVFTFNNNPAILSCTSLRASFNLLLSNSSGRLALYEVCRLVASIHFPSRVAEIIEPKSRETKFLIEYPSLNQCLEITGSLNQRVLFGETLRFELSACSIDELDRGSELSPLY